MFGSRSLEQQLFEGIGKRAKATVLTRDGIGGGTYRHSVRVEPQDEQPFSAKIKTRGVTDSYVSAADARGSHQDMERNVLDRLFPGMTAWVLYDPNDHSKITFDIATTFNELFPQRTTAYGGGQVMIPGVHVDVRVLGAGGGAPDPARAQAKLNAIAALRDSGLVNDAVVGAVQAQLEAVLGNSAAAPPPPPAVPAGWHPDPNNAQLQRYWDGTAWTEHTAPLA
jgi:hypothetical protein